MPGMLLSLLQPAALLLLLLGVLLFNSGLGFPGLDLLVGLLVAGALLAAGTSIMREQSLFWGATTAALAAVALALHFALNFGWV